MKHFLTLIVAAIICSNLFAQGQERVRALLHTTDSLQVTVWNNGLVGDNAMTGGLGRISWNGIDGIWVGSLSFGTQTRGSVNGGNASGASFYDMVNVSSNFAGGFLEETAGEVTFDQVTMAVISDSSATNPFGFDVIQKTYSKTGENVVFCRNGYVKNSHPDVIGLYAGFGGDWDVGNPQLNSGGVDVDVNLAYVYESGTDNPYFGFMVLDTLSGCSVSSTEFGTVTDLREAAFTYISDIYLTDPGVGDQKSAVGSFVGDVAVGDTAWATFAIVAGNDLEGIRANAKRAFEIAYDAGWTDIIVSDPTDVENDNVEEIIPKDFILYQNYPNPFNPSTVIEYSIPQEVKGEKSKVKKVEESITTLKIYDVLGREVSTLVNKQQRPGNYTVNFDASSLSSGVYFYKLTAGSFVNTKKMLLLR